MPTSADLVAVAQALLKRKMGKFATIVQWGAGQIDMLTTWQTTAQGQLDSQAATITDLRYQVTDYYIVAITNLKATCDRQEGQIVDLQSQLAAAMISPLSLVMIDTHLYGFSSVDASQAFYDANPGQPKQMFKVTDFQMDPPGSTT